MAVPVITQDQDAIIALEDFEGVPVLIHEGDRYPSFADDVPYISVSLHGRTEGTYNFALVRAHGGRQRVVPVNARKFLAGMHGPERPIGELLAEARQLFPLARRELVAMHEKFDRAEALYAEIADLPNPMTRADYIAACRAYGLSPRPDDALSHWGVYTFPEHSLEELPRLLIDQRRAFAVENEKRRRIAEERERAALERDALAETLRHLPAVQSYSVVVPAGTTPAEWIRGRSLHSVVGRTPRAPIGPDDPLMHGAHLVGHEGEPAEIITVEVREAR